MKDIATGFFHFRRTRSTPTFGFRTLAGKPWGGRSWGPQFTGKMGPGVPFSRIPEILWQRNISRPGVLPKDDYVRSPLVTADSQTTRTKRLCHTVDTDNYLSMFDFGEVFIHFYAPNRLGACEQQRWCRWGTTRCYWGTYPRVPHPEMFSQLSSTRHACRAKLVIGESVAWP